MIPPRVRACQGRPRSSAWRFLTLVDFGGGLQVTVNPYGSYSGSGFGDPGISKKASWACAVRGARCCPGVGLGVHHADIDQLMWLPWRKKMNLFEARRISRTRPCAITSVRCPVTAIACHREAAPDQGARARVGLLRQRSRRRGRRNLQPRYRRGQGPGRARSRGIGGVRR